MERKLKPCCNCHTPSVIWKRRDKKLWCKDCWYRVGVNQEGETKPAPIPKKSDRRAKLDAAYSVLRKAYLEAHPDCELQCSDECTGRATEIHHLYWAGNREEYMNDFTEVKGGCHNCHDFVHTKMSTEQAVRRGFRKFKDKKYEEQPQES